MQFIITGFIKKVIFLFFLAGNSVGQVKFFQLLSCIFNLYLYLITIIIKKRIKGGTS